MCLANNTGPRGTLLLAMATKEPSHERPYSHPYHETSEDAIEINFWQTGP